MLCANVVAVDESPRVARLRKLHANRARIENEINDLVYDAVEAGDDQTQIAASIHRSREWVRVYVNRRREREGLPPRGKSSS